MGSTIIERVFIYQIICAAAVVGGIIAILLFIRWALKGDAKFKRIFAISLAVAAVAAAIMGTELSKIYLDIKNQDYVTYCGEYVERGGGQRDLKTVVVYDEDGKEIRLLRTGPSKQGTFEGTVIYGRRSRVVVEYSDTVKQ